MPKEKTAGILHASLPERGIEKQSYFDTLSQARNWLQEAQYNDKHKSIVAPFDMVAKDIVSSNAELPELNDMTVDGFFEFWMNHLIPDLRSNTKRNYRDRYIHNIQPVIGRLKVEDVRPFHCKKGFARYGRGLFAFYCRSNVYCDGNFI